MSDNDFDLNFDLQDSLAVPPGRFRGASPIYRLLNLLAVLLYTAFGIFLISRMVGG